MDEAEARPLITAKLTFGQAQDTREKVTAQLYEDTLVFSAPGFSSTLRLGALLGIRASDYRVFIDTGGADIELSMVGHLYEDFTHKLIRAYNEVLFKQSLMSEKAHFEAPGQYISPAGETAGAVFRICETALVILPHTHMLVRIPYCMIAGVRNEPYRFEVTDKLGRVYVLQKLGRLTDTFLREYDARVSQLRRQTREKLSEIAPVDDALAELLMEGMLVPLSDIRAISSVFAEALHSRLAASEIAQEYAYLRALSPYMAVGVKRGLKGELTGETIHTLTPVFEKNVMVLESLGDAATATYVFRMGADGKASLEDWPGLLLRFNDSMLAVNYRREPIYLTEEALASDKYENYRGALHRSEGLRALRRLFVGRASHSGIDAWRKAIESYLL